MMTTTLPVQKSKTKPQRPYAVIVHNDDIHTFGYVIDCFMKVFGYSKEKSIELATTIHESGLAIVWSGSLEVAELKKEQIESMGPDHNAIRKCEAPLKVSIEQLP